jgi:hypothetical protein
MDWATILSDFLNKTIWSPCLNAIILYILTSRNGFQFAPELK